MDRDEDVVDDVSLLIIVLETNSRVWFPVAASAEAELEEELEEEGLERNQLCRFEDCVRALSTFASAYLALNRANRISVIAAHEQRKCEFLYRSHLEGDFDSSSKQADGGSGRPSEVARLFVGDDEIDEIGTMTMDADADAMDISRGLEPLQTSFRKTFFEALRELGGGGGNDRDGTTRTKKKKKTKTNEDDSNNNNREEVEVETGIENDSNQSSSPIAGAISLALTYANRVERDPGLRGRVKSRILVCQASEDDSEQYVPMMNAMFAAQSANILIDCLSLNERDSSFLQQAAFVSGGVYAKPEKSEHLLQRLLMSFLPDRYARRFLRPPRAGSIDFRSSCFCHGNRISKGFVCSVCLSVFCESSASCLTCNAQFA